MTVVAGIAGTADDRTFVLRAAVRGDLAGFAAPVTLGRLSVYDATPPAVTVGPRGDAVVAWKEFRGGPIDPDRSVRILAARRPAAPGARFGRAEEVVPWTRHEDFETGESDVAAGIDASGRVTVAWAAPAPPEARVSELSAIGVSTAAPGEPLRRVRVRRTLQGVGRLSLAVAPDGAALLATTGQEQVHVFERPTGARRFTEREPLGPDEQTADEAAVALGPDGAALVAWRYTAYDDAEAGEREGVNVARRPPGGQFSAPVPLWSQTRPGGSTASAIALDDKGPPLDQSRLRADVAADGRTTITWIAPFPTEGDRLPAGWAATAGTDGPFTVARVGSPCRPVNGITPARAGDGRPTLAWTDNVAIRVDDDLEVPFEAGRVHVADSPPQPPAASPAPKLTLAAPRGTQRVWSDDPIKVDAECDGPCDLRAFVPGRRSPRAASGAALRAAGRTDVPVYSSLSPLVGRTARDIPIVVHACAPDGTSRARATTTVRAVRNRPPPVPTPVGVSARRVGGEVVVSWHTPFAARRTSFIVYGLTGRSLRSGSATEPGFVEGRARRRFRVRLRVLPGKRARYVTVDAQSTEERGGKERTTVSVR